MEDDKIKDLFAGFDPELPSDSLFMDRLRRNLDSVEIVRERNAAFRRRSRVAIAAAAVVGFVVGMLFSLALPYVGSMVRDLALPSGTLLGAIADNYLVVSWLIIGATSVFMALNAYDLTLYLSRRR